MGLDRVGIFEDGTKITSRVNGRYFCVTNGEIDGPRWCKLVPGANHQNLRLPVIQLEKVVSQP